MQCTRGLRGGSPLPPKWEPARPQHTPDRLALASSSVPKWEPARPQHTPRLSEREHVIIWGRRDRSVRPHGARVVVGVESVQAVHQGAADGGEDARCGEQRGERSAWHTWGHRHREAPGPGFSLSPRRPRPAQCLGPAGRQTGGETRLVEPARQQVRQGGIVVRDEQHGARDAPSPTGCGSTWGRWTRTTFPWCGQSPWPTRPTGRCGSGRRGLPCRSCTAQWPCPWYPC